MRLNKGIAAPAQGRVGFDGWDSGKVRRLVDAFAFQWAGCCTQTQNAGDLSRRFQLRLEF
jgi:hypothetical protein